MEINPMHQYVIIIFNSGIDIKLIHCVLGMTLNSSIVVQGMTVKLRPCFERVDEAVSGGKHPAGKGVDSLLSWNGSHFWVCITFL